MKMEMIGFYGELVRELYWGGSGQIIKYNLISVGEWLQDGSDVGMSAVGYCHGGRGQLASPDLSSQVQQHLRAQALHLHHRNAVLLSSLST